MAPAPEIAVEVVYALPGEQVLVTLRLAAGATVADAIRHSGLRLRYPQINSTALCAGVFGNKVAMDARLKDGDRVQIYRPLTVDPKEARRRRVMLRSAGKAAV